MLEERPLLQEADVRAAERREVYGDHPVIVVLDRLWPQIQQLNSQYPDTGEMSIDGITVSNRLRFLIDALIEAPSFDLEPLAIVAIWSKMTEAFPTETFLAARFTDPSRSLFTPSSYRTALAGTISIVHAIREEQNPSWRKFPYTYLGERTLPVEVTKESDSLTKIRGQLQIVVSNVRELGFYQSGTRESTSRLLNAVLAGDPEAVRKMAAHETFVNRRSTPVLGDISHSFGNGMMYSITLVEAALSGLNK